MSDAKRSLSRAVEVKSDKYAPGELKNAKEYLYKSHSDIARSDIETAKQNASVSLDFSQKAIDKSLPLLARDSLEDARKNFKKAENVHSERYTADEYRETWRLIREAERLNDSGDYWNSYLKSNASMVPARKAINKSLAQVPIIKRGIEVIREQLANMEAGRGKDFAPEEIGRINEKLNEAFNKTDEELLKFANITIDDVIGLLEIANRKIHKGVANEKIIYAEQVIEAIKLSKKYYRYDEYITKSYNLINKTRQLFQTDMYEVLIPTVDEAMAVFDDINKSMIDEVKNIFALLSKINLKTSFVNDTNYLSKLISDAVKLRESGKYGESVKKINRADEIIAAINRKMIDDADRVQAGINSSGAKNNSAGYIEKASGLIGEAKKSYDAGYYDRSIPAIDEASVILNRIGQSIRNPGTADVKKTGMTDTKHKKGK